MLDREFHRLRWRKIDGAARARLLQVGEIVKHEPVDEAIGAAYAFEQRTFARIIEKRQSPPGEAICTGEPEANHQMLKSTLQPHFCNDQGSMLSHARGDLN